MAESTKELTDEGAKVTTTVEGSDATAAAPAEPKKGYWIIHLLSIKNEEKFFEHLSLANSKTKYGGKTRIFAPVKATLKGDPVAFCAVIEFPSVQAAIDCWDDEEDYAEARKMLGDPETDVVDRRVCVIEASPLPELKPGQGFWCWRSVEFGVASIASSSTPSMRRVPTHRINHVHAVKDKEKFMAYAGPAMALTTSATFGPVVHQHVGAGATSYSVAFAAAFGLESAQAGLDLPSTEAYQAAKAAGSMAEGEDDVVDRTICVIEYDPQYDQLAAK